MKRRNSVANLPSLAEVDAVLSLVVPEIEQNISFFFVATHHFSREHYTHLQALKVLYVFIGIICTS